MGRGHRHQSITSRPGGPEIAFDARRRLAARPFSRRSRVGRSRRGARSGLWAEAWRLDAAVRFPDRRRRDDAPAGAGPRGDRHRCNLRGPRNHRPALVPSATAPPDPLLAPRPGSALGRRMLRRRVRRRDGSACRRGALGHPRLRLQQRLVGSHLRRRAPSRSRRTNPQRRRLLLPEAERALQQRLSDRQPHVAAVRQRARRDRRVPHLDPADGGRGCDDLSGRLLGDPRARRARGLRRTRRRDHRLGLPAVLLSRAGERKGDRDGARALRDRRAPRRGAGRRAPMGNSRARRHRGGGDARHLRRRRACLARTGRAGRAGPVPLAPPPHSRDYLEPRSGPGVRSRELRRWSHCRRWRHR